MSDALDSFSIFNSVLQPSSNQLNRMKQQMTELAGTPSSQPKAKDVDDNDNDKLKMGGIIKELAEAHQKQGKTELPEEFRGILNDQNPENQQKLVDEIAGKIEENLKFDKASFRNDLVVNDGSNDGSNDESMME